MAADEPDTEATPDSNIVVALYDFDPSAVDWPFRRQRPLALQTGRRIKIIHDDGSEWALGHYFHQPLIKGYFPKNYTVSEDEYRQMQEDYAMAEQEPQKREDDDEELPGPPETKALPEDLPEIDMLAPMEMYEPEDLPEIQIAELASYPVLEPVPPIPTTFEVNKARLLCEPPPVPRLRPADPAPPSEEIDRALMEVVKEHDESIKDQVRLLPGGQLSDSRASTPATRTLTRPERDFVRQYLPAPNKDDKVQKLSNVRELLMRSVRQAREQKPAFPIDLRTRSTTVRLAGDVKPDLMKKAIQDAAEMQLRWKQMFRPAFNDLVNESYRVGCNSCILSRFYLEDEALKEQFQKIHCTDVGGTLWFELKRRKEHLFYMRMEGFDVMMCHPDAWGFPDATRYVKAAKGDACNPMHGWLAQNSIDTDREMEDVEFCYTLRLRTFPEKVFNDLALGKVPKWIEPYTALQGEASLEDVKQAEDGAAQQNQKGDKNLLAEAGMENGDDVYVKMDELRLARERTVGPDILDARTESYRLKGLSAMRLFYRSKGKPDNMKQTLISPKLVKDMAAQLGIKGDFRNYWYSFFALRYPLAPDWECIVKNDTRWYLHLPTDRMQPVHPLIKAFRVHLNDIIENAFLWDFRGFVRMKCSSCGVPDAVLWCMQCTDYFCTKCFHVAHKSERGKKHYSLPVPGCRYLTRTEVNRIEEYLPLLNIGFSNRRRFLAMSNQSDKMGTTSGDPWLCFHADSFQAALVQCPKDHWHVKRSNPPRLRPGQDTYFYNFEKEILADDSDYITLATHEQAALSLLQKSFRGALTRRRILRETEAAVVIQKTKMMWDVLKVYGNNGRNASILKSWYRKYRAKEDRKKLENLVAHVQGAWRGLKTRLFYRRKIMVLSKFQAAFRGRRSRRQLYVEGPSIRIRSLQSRPVRFQPDETPGRPDAELVSLQTRNNSGRIHNAVVAIQRYYRGHLHGRVLMAEKRQAAARIQAMVRGVLYRMQMQSMLEKPHRLIATERLTRETRANKKVEMVLPAWCAHPASAYVDVYKGSVTRIQARWRGMRGRQRVKTMHAAGLKIQTNWRRFCAQIDVKQILFTRMDEMFRQRKEILDKKVMVSAVEMLQRGFRRYMAYQKYVFMKKEKGDADKRTQTLIVAMFAATGSLRHHVHPWWRHLPPEIQEVLEQIKNPMQRTISNVAITGKMANEEIGKRGLRVAHVNNLTYKQSGKDPDLASHLFISVTRHLLSLVPAELFGATVKWACYSIAHKSVELSKKGVLEQNIIPVGKDMPPHPGDSLATLYSETAGIKTDIESYLRIPDVSLPMTVLHALSPHHRQVYLTAETLITMRQALDTPSLSTEDHLKFQGLDLPSGAQLMEILGSELDHALPLDWPKSFGTVAALAAQMATHVAELVPQRQKGHGGPKVVKKKDKHLADVVKDTKKDEEKHEDHPQKGGKKQGQQGGEQTDTKGKPKTKAKAKSRKAKAAKEAVDELGHLSHFNRAALFRVIQQISYLMRDQDQIVNTVLASEEGLTRELQGQGVRTSRYITVTEKLFDMADSSKHDHCSFVLAVVIFHMVIRGLMMRVVYHRAAMALQKRYRYLKRSGNKYSMLQPALQIQRFWRGLQARLKSMRLINAGKTIARNYKIILSKRRSAKLVRSIVTIQRYARGYFSRRWCSHMQDAAVFIQKFVRKLLVRVVLDKPGRDVIRKHQKAMNLILQTKDSRTESDHLARCCALNGKMIVDMEKHRQRNVELRRALSFNLRSKHTRKEDRAKMMAKVGRVQPQRESVFEAMVSGMARLEPRRLPFRYDCKQSRILKLIQNSKDLLNRTLVQPDEVDLNKSWICTRRVKDAESGEESVCKAANMSGVVFCIGCGKKQYGRQHAAAALGEAALVAMRKAKGTSKAADKKRESQHSHTLAAGSWGRGVFQVS
mmetsp:Transcript_109430/g.172525  ORF Transcript_109430/g.172525 Transcript_109430/m.172525 type:complete len:1919 (-) Transcript_109430:123-5879(-)